jgi:hypothetical protein
MDRFLLSIWSMGGFITERDFDAAECEFPGIQRLYERLVKKPRTFLELVWTYERTTHDEAAATQAAHDGEPRAGT